MSYISLYIGGTSFQLVLADTGRSLFRDNGRTWRNG